MTHRRFRPGPGSLWRHRDFVLLWTGETASQVGTRIGQVALPLLAVTVLGATPWQMGLLSAAQTAGFLLIGLLAGVLLDRVRRFPVMVAADLVRFLLLLTIPVAGWYGVLGYPQVLAVVFLAGLATVFFDVAYQSVLPSLVGRSHLVEGNGKLESTRSTAEAGGPALGGGLVQLLGAAGAIAIDALSFLASAVVLSRIRTVEPAPPGSGTSVRQEIGEGLRFVWRHRLLRPIVLCTATANLFTGVQQAALALFLARDLAQPAGVVGLVLAGTGAGAVLGALTAGRWTRRLGQARTIVLSLLVTSPVMLLVPLAQPGILLGAAVLGLLALGYGSVVYNVAQVSFRQAVCPDRLLGRMNASTRFLVWGTIPLGGLLGGALGETIGAGDVAGGRRRHQPRPAVGADLPAPPAARSAHAPVLTSTHPSSGTTAKSRPDRARLPDVPPAVRRIIRSRRSSALGPAQSRRSTIDEFGPSAARPRR